MSLLFEKTQNFDLDGGLYKLVQRFDSPGEGNACQGECKKLHFWLS